MRSQPKFEIGDDNVVSMRLPPPIKTKQIINPPTSTKVCVCLNLTRKIQPRKLQN